MTSCSTFAPVTRNDTNPIGEAITVCARARAWKPDRLQPGETPRGFVTLLAAAGAVRVSRETFRGKTRGGYAPFYHSVCSKM